jgi:DNA polymerase IV (family X)
MSYPQEDVDAFEFRMHDPVTDEWFYYQATSWEEFEKILISVSKHRGHPMELWAISRIDFDPFEPMAPWADEGGNLLLPWKRVATMVQAGPRWDVSMNGEGSDYSMGASRQRRVKPNKMKLAQAQRLAARIEKTLAPYSDFIMVVGSVRREASTVGDIELVVLPKDLEEFLGTLQEEGFHGGTRKQVGSVRGMTVEIYLAHDPKEIGGLVFMYTGDFQFNIAMRRKAKRRGLKLNQYGIWKGSKPVLQSDDEVDFFEFLDVRYHEPQERSLAARGKAKPAMAGAEYWDDEEDS